MEVQNNLSSLIFSGDITFLILTFLKSPRDSRNFCLVNSFTWNNLRKIFNRKIRNLREGYRDNFLTYFDLVYQIGEKGNGKFLGGFSQVERKKLAQKEFNYSLILLKTKRFCMYCFLSKDGCSCFDEDFNVHDY